MTSTSALNSLSSPGTPHPHPGVFVVFEGGDGAGKSTQVEVLRDRCERAGHRVVVTREPGGTSLGAQVRELLLHGDAVSPRAEALLFAADRAHHVATVIRPALMRGDVVISDRFVDSSIAYQGAGRSLTSEDIAALSAWATEGLRPTLTVLLDVDPAVGRERCGVSPDRMEREAAEFHDRVRQGFVELAVQDPVGYLVRDAALPVEQIALDVWSRVAPLLPAGVAS
ncbi:3-hydroxybutyryl-CoA dehydrogenase [Platysternon megacephalum]|uniref:dTMP kinase n=1 Tax=Platysternon megacephalum TaxID=55544 RepID=A0A4D9DH96_9SAUR|nr:3-hydroxybutyryl-CoA dehydrogenase [Platysternon megacephalum]